MGGDVFLLVFFSIVVYFLEMVVRIFGSLERFKRIWLICFCFNLLDVRVVLIVLSDIVCLFGWVIVLFVVI